MRAGCRTTRWGASCPSQAHASFQVRSSGGRTADPVGRSLWALARTHQVLVVTHLPQIAAHADAHYRIAKRERDGRTITEIERLDREGRIVELAAMLGGAPATAADATEADAVTGDGDAPLASRAGLVPVGPGMDADDPDQPIDLGEVDPRDLVADPPAAPLASAALASARELLDAAEAWRGRPVVPV